MNTANTFAVISSWCGCFLPDIFQRQGITNKWKVTAHDTGLPVGIVIIRNSCDMAQSLRAKVTLNCLIVTGSYTNFEDLSRVTLKF